MKNTITRQQLISRDSEVGFLILKAMTDLDNKSFHAIGDSGDLLEIELTINGVKVPANNALLNFYNQVADRTDERATEIAKERLEVIEEQAKKFSNLILNAQELFTEKLIYGFNMSREDLEDE